MREPLILATGGAELKSYAAGAQALVLLVYVPFYGRLAARLPVTDLISRVNLAMAACVLSFFAAGWLGIPYVGFVFYVFVGVFSLTLIAQFWSFANDIYVKSDGDRLFPIIAIGATAGAPIGAALASELFDLGVSPWIMMLIAAGLLLLHTTLYRAVGRRGSGAPSAKNTSANGFAMVAASPSLRLLALLLVLLNIVNTTGEYILANLVTERASELTVAHALFGTGGYWLGEAEAKTGRISNKAAQDDTGRDGA